MNAARTLNLFSPSIYPLAVYDAQMLYFVKKRVYMV